MTSELDVQALLRFAKREGRYRVVWYDQIVIRQEKES